MANCYEFRFEFLEIGYVVTTIGETILAVDLMFSGRLSVTLRHLDINSQDRTHGNGYKLEKYRFRTDIGRYWFTNRVVNDWNRLGRQGTASYRSSAGLLQSHQFLCSYLYSK